MVLVSGTGEHLFRANKSRHKKIVALSIGKRKASFSLPQVPNCGRAPVISL